jgi:murein DD-endopeptidase MepM/ murein hydrolase activator NlpD
MKPFSLFVALIFFTILSNAQSNFGGGPYEHQGGECVPAHEYIRINAMLEANVQSLQRQGLLTVNRTEGVNYGWPVKQAEGFTYNNVYGISNYVDHDPESSGGSNGTLTDYNCGIRSYDLDNGYDHKGTDIFSWPFSWQMMQDNQVEIIAIADGVIIGKDDGNPDQSCSFDVSTPWNAVYVQHADGSRAWYGHLKTNSLTTKAVGESVAEGEYLGIMGSSGVSTGPHLHLELYGPDNQLVDPYVGSCNPTVTESCWAEQQNYREPTINTIFTHQFDPGFLSCPTPGQQVEIHNKSNCFEEFDRAYFAAYFRDQMAGEEVLYRVYRPNGSAFKAWSHSSPETYNASYWYWWYNLPLGSPEGLWTFEVTYAGETLSHNFWVGEVESEAITGPEVSAVAEIANYTVPEVPGYTYEWSLSNGSILSGQGESTLQLQWEEGMTGEVCVTATNPMGCSSDPTCLSVDLLPASAASISGLADWAVFPNPAREQLHLRMEWTRQEQIRVQLYSPLGAVVRALPAQNIAPGNTQLSLDIADLPTGVYFLTIQNEQAVLTRRVVVE